jgi:hypothetical protein
MIFARSDFVSVLCASHREDAERFVVRADENLTAFLELESAILCLSIGDYNHQDANR